MSGSVNDPPDCFDQSEPITAPITGSNASIIKCVLVIRLAEELGLGVQIRQRIIENKSGMGHQGVAQF